MVGPADIRDTRKDAAYFDEQLRRDTESLAKFRAVIAAPDTPPERRKMLLHTVFRRELEQLIARYSRGDSVEALRAAYPRVIDALVEYENEPDSAAQDFDNFDAYVFALWILSLAILLDIDEAETARAIGALDNEGRDAVYDRLRALRSPGKGQSPTVIYPTPYLSLLRTLDATGDEQTRSARRFLDAWYDGMAPAYWRGSHSGADAGYFGYWCFELAAFVKALGIDDGSFLDHPCYPRDLAHT